MKSTSCVFFLVLLACSGVPDTNQAVPSDFVKKYYEAYSGIPKADRLSPFYADSVVIDDPTYDWKGNGKEEIFKNFDSNNLNNHYTWRVDQQLMEGSMLVTEGLLKARYGDVPYEMRFVNIFHFEDGKIIRQFDYFDSKDWYKAVEEWKNKKALP